jgi:hypothetical protein
MPGFGGTFSGAQIDALVLVVRTFDPGRQR